jgi:hypothetical protein
MAVKALRWREPARGWGGNLNLFWPPETAKCELHRVVDQSSAGS